MFKKRDDDTYAFSGRFWTYAVIAAILIGWIGWRTQITSDRTTQVSRETLAFARQTNDCLNQVLLALDDRQASGKQLNALIDQRSALVDKRAAVWDKFIIDVAQVPTDLPQSERDRLTRPIVDKFIVNINSIEVENIQINADRQAALAKLSASAFPAPNCGNKLPGQ